MSMFKLQEDVRWTSSSAGSTTTKVGFIEAVIAAGKVPTQSQRKEADAYGAARDHASYLVRVPGKTPASKGKLYWPRVSLLQSMDAAVVMRKLQGSGREVRALKEATAITLNTRCPDKWAMVDLETGEVWAHDGATFQKASQQTVGDVVALAERLGKRRR